MYCLNLLCDFQLTGLFFQCLKDQTDFQAGLYVFVIILNVRGLIKNSSGIVMCNASPQNRDDV